ncbi:MAG: acyl carrier protein [Proteobacteria bacterium]|nr:acyl carrier protein [Pseudomonadota bacterium]
MLSKDEVYDRLAQRLTEMFEVPSEKIRPDARLYEDLDLDSIDAVDLIVKLQDLTGKRVSPQDFKSVRTVSDVVDKVRALLDA